MCRSSMLALQLFATTLVVPVALGSEFLAPIHEPSVPSASTPIGANASENATSTLLSVNTSLLGGAVGATLEVSGSLPGDSADMMAPGREAAAPPAAGIDASGESLPLELVANSSWLSGPAEIELAAVSGCAGLPYSGPAEGAESCFCHKSGNPSCASKPCTCREGCGEGVQRGSAMATFYNRARSTCKGAMLTIPSAYLTDIGDAKRKCVGTQSLLAAMMQQGFQAYQGVQSGPVMQCIHKPHAVSVRWLHLHTFCQTGQVDGMPNQRTAYCVKMSSAGEAGTAAAQLLSRV